MQQLFYVSCILGDIQQLNELLTPPVMDALQPPASNPNLSYSVLLYNYGIQVACKNHHTDIVRLLLAYEPMKPYIDFSMSNHFSLRTVCREGYDDIVRMIVAFQPYHTLIVHQLDTFISVARSFGHTHVIRLLQTPMYYDRFCRDIYFHNKVETGLRLLCYQDILKPMQRKNVIAYMTAWLVHILIELPTDIVKYICTF